ncbi:MAG TPA: hypothetical protein VMR18_01480 [Candidatus Saccharimonadales bacterium]|jgi:hypothetical protein|nr:hypothetical protein [Candidatus Saccharimonadales bacterium]
MTLSADMKKDKQTNTKFSLRSDRTPSIKNSPFLYYGKETKLTTDVSRVDGRRKNLNDPTSTSENHWWKYLPSVLAILVIIFCAGYELLLSNNPKVVILSNGLNSSVVFTGSSKVYQQYAEKLFGKSLYDRNKLTVNTAQIASDMQKQFPAVANVSITLPLLGNQPTIYIEPDSPVIILQNESSGTFAIDSNGKAIDKISNLTSVQNLGLPLVVDQTNIAISPGEEALPTGDVNFIELVIEQLKANSIPISSLVLPSQSRELDVYPGGGVAYFVRFNLDDGADAKQQIGTFLAARQYLITNKITPSQYIDARVLGRVYYK